MTALLLVLGLSTLLGLLLLRWQFPAHYRYRAGQAGVGPWSGRGRRPRDKHSRLLDNCKSTPVASAASCRSSLGVALLPNTLNMRTVLDAQIAPPPDSSSQEQSYCPPVTRAKTPRCLLLLIQSDLAWSFHLLNLAQTMAPFSSPTYTT